MASLATMLGGASLSFGQTQNNGSEQHYDVSPIAMVEETEQLWQQSAHTIEYQKTLSDLKMCQNEIGGTYIYDSDTKTGIATIAVNGYTKTIKTNSQGMPIQLIEDFGNSRNETCWRDNCTLKSKTSDTNSDLLLKHTQEEYDEKGNLESFSSSTEYRNLNRSKKIEKQFKNGYLISESTLVNNNGKQKTSSTKIEQNGSETTVTTEINGAVRIQKYSKNQLVWDSNTTEKSKAPMSTIEKQKRLEKYQK